MEVEVRVLPHCSPQPRNPWAILGSRGTQFEKALDQMLPSNTVLWSQQCHSQWVTAEEPWIPSQGLQAQGTSVRPHSDADNEKSAFLFLPRGQERRWALGTPRGIRVRLHSWHCGGWEEEEKVGEEPTAQGNSLPFDRR